MKLGDTHHLPSLGDGGELFFEGGGKSHPDLGRPLGAGARGPADAGLLFCCMLDSLVLFLSLKSSHLLFLLSQKSQDLGAYGSTKMSAL